VADPPGVAISVADAVGVLSSGGGVVGSAGRLVAGNGVNSAVGLLVELDDGVGDTLRIVGWGAPQPTTTVSKRGSPAVSRYLRTTSILLLLLLMTYGHYTMRSGFDEVQETVTRLTNLLRTGSLGIWHRSIPGDPRVATI
jgi:hypothetical protein